MRRTIKIVSISIAVIAIIIIALFLLSYKPIPSHIEYGMSYNTVYARELGLDPRQTFIAILDELKVRHFRLAAHWNMVEPTKDTYDWSENDFQLQEAQKRGADVIFAVGRRLPRWPECHIPTWAKDLPWEDQKKEIRQYLTDVVTRYKDNPSIIYWQVENEPFLGVFAPEHCGALDENFLQEEVALVRSLDATRPVLVTDSGNLGTWRGAYSLGDAFGTSVYVYFWNPQFGQFKTILPSFAYRAKEGLMKMLYGKKPTFLIELSLEPWLLEPVTAVPIEIQYARMDGAKFDEILKYAKDTRYDKQYLWGAEWWYWLRLKGHPDMWEKGKQIFSE